jgi:WD40 repeat protein/serine/threonine protein kinase
MSESINVDESLIQRLPLPLAKLVRRAQNAKTPLDRHQAAYYLWEASLKLLASVAVVEFAELGEHDAKLVEMLQNLARPMVGHWWEFVRRLTPPLADSGDEGFRRVRDLLLGRSRDDLPRVAGLDAAIVAHLQQAKPAARSTVQLAELYNRLVEYRNKEAAGHGALGMRPQGSFYDRMARALLGGMIQLLDKLDVLAGRRLIYAGDVRRQSTGDWLVERYELVGESARRIESLQVPDGQKAALPRPERVYIERTGPDLQGAAGRMLCLSPLIHFQPELEQVFFLNARRGKQKAEYLCYHDGEQLRRDVMTDQRELLASVLKMGVDTGDFEAWAGRSQVAEPVEEGAVEPARGARTIGEFELLSRLGQGGMGVVYRAWQASLARQVALKCMLKTGDPKAEARFAREIRALGRVEHPGVVKVFTSGSEADHWFFAMELVEGADLARVCEQLSGRKAPEVDDTTWREALTSACAAARSSEVPLSSSDQAAERLAQARSATDVSGNGASEAVAAAVRGPGYVSEVVEIIQRVAEAADALHEAGIVHRDIKPGNIMVGRDGKTPVLMDLGLAQLADEAEGRLTRTRQFIGTLRYASPEQVLAASRVDRRSDIYALGATLWELLTLRPFFGATDDTPTPKLMEMILYAEPASPRKLNPSVPPDLEAIALKCLEKEKTRRYATAGELAADLGRFLRNEPVTARLSSPWELTVKWMRRRPAIVAMSAAILLVALLGMAGAFWEWRRAVASAREALIARDEADAQRKEATAQAKEAVAARNEAKDQARKALLARDEADAERKEATEQAKNALLARNEAKDQERKAILARDEVKKQRDTVRLSAYIAHMNLAQREWEDAHVARVLDLLAGERPKPGEADLRGFEWFYLNRLCDSGLRTLKGHKGGVKAVAFSPDGTRIASASLDGTVMVWNGNSGKEPLVLAGHTEGVTGVAFSHDGRRIATSSFDQTVKIWDAASGHELLTRKGHTGFVTGVAFSPDDRRIASAGYDRTIMIWENGHVPKSLRHRGPSRVVIGVAFSPEGRRIASGSADGTVTIWDAISASEALTIPRHDGAVNAVAFSPDGRRVASASDDHTAKVWDIATTLDALTLRGHTAAVSSVTYSRDGRRIATASFDGTVKVWDAGSGQELHTFRGHTERITSVAFSPDGCRIASGSFDRTVKEWDAGCDQETLTFDKHTGEVKGVAFSPDSSRIASASSDHTVKLWDASSGLVVRTLTGHTGEVRGVAFSPDGSRIAAAGDGQTVKIWNARSGHEMLTLKGQGGLAPHGVAFSPDGRRIASADGPLALTIWDASSGRKFRTFRAGWFAGQGVAFSPDGRRIASASEPLAVKVWDAASGDETLTLNGHTARVSALAFSPDGRRIASASYDHTVKIWDAGSGQEQLTLKGHNGTVNGVAFSPDGRRIASASDDQTLKVWETATGQETLTLRGHTLEVMSVAFSPDGRRIASAGCDRTIKVWDARQVRDGFHD